MTQQALENVRIGAFDLMPSPEEIHARVPLSEKGPVPDAPLLLRSCSGSARIERTFRFPYVNTCSQVCTSFLCRQLHPSDESFPCNYCLRFCSPASSGAPDVLSATSSFAKFRRTHSKDR